MRGYAVLDTPRYRDLAKRSKEREATSKRRAHGGQHLAAFQEINASTNSVNSVSVRLPPCLQPPHAGLL